jgi:CubicO group peptidase (beta-lactamase class C family)
MSARDLARFALLYLHRGAWNGRQIVPADWVDESTRPYSTTPTGPGYGFLWWTAAEHGVLPKGSFFAWGNGGQFAFVVPAYDLVVVNRVDRDEHLPSPKLREVTRLLQLIFEAGGLVPAA